MTDTIGDMVKHLEGYRPLVAALNGRMFGHAVRDASARPYLLLTKEESESEHFSRTRLDKSQVRMVVTADDSDVAERLLLQAAIRMRRAKFQSTPPARTVRVRIASGPTTLEVGRGDDATPIYESSILMHVSREVAL